GAWGASAGGHLAALLGTSGGVEELSGSGGNPEQSSRVQAVCDWYGPSDLVRLGEHTGHRAAGNPLTALLGGPVAEKLEVARLGSPVTHVSPDDPPFLIMHGDEDRTVPLEQSRILESALRKAGVEATLHVVEGAGHGFTGADVDRMVNEFFDLHLKGGEKLALHERSFTSEAAKGPVRYLLYLPPGYESETERRYPVVYWLHGRGGDPRGGTPFVRSIDRAIRDGKAPPMIVVLADGKKDSMYCDAKDGTSPVETTIVGELIPEVDATLRTVASRGGRGVAGFSMGGFGAAHLAFKFPDLFGAASIVGGALHDGETLVESRREIFRKVFGGDPEYFEAQSPWKLVTENAERIRGRTRVRLVVGERDVLLPRSMSFHEHLEKLDIPHGFIVVRGVGHTHVRIYEETRELTAEFYSEVFE
ncbi:MAG: alpha/beta hydrolase-fold protein, partial [Planctomycetota bacterium]